MVPTSSRLVWTRIAAVAIALSWSALTAAQSARIDGTWTGEATAAASPSLPVTIVFKTSGTSVTGFVSVDEAPQVPIEEGVLQGNKLSFWFSWFGGDTHCEGVVTDKEIRLKAPTEIGITFDIVLKRKA